MICLFTDGSSLQNPGDAGAAVAVVRDGVLYAQYGFPMKGATNNMAELTAACIALEYARVCHIRWPKDRVLLVADSKYVLNGLRKCDIWRLPEELRPNNDLWEVCYQKLLLVGCPVLLKWVHGHKGYPMNEYCDKLARKAAKEQKVIEWTKM